MTEEQFPVIYNDATFTVNMKNLTKLSTKISTMYQHYIQGNPLESAQLIMSPLLSFSPEILTEYLKICSNIPAEIHPESMKDICELSRLYGTDSIYMEYLGYIHNQGAANFQVPADEYDHHPPGQPFLQIVDKIKVQEEEERQAKIKRVYQIKATLPSFQRNTYYFVYNDEVLQTAKKRRSKIIIGQGDKVHWKKDKSNYVCKIQHGEKDARIVLVSDQRFLVNYTLLPKSKKISVDVQFKYNDQNVHWSPVDESLCSYKYISPKISGKYSHIPIKSPKNAVLQDKDGNNMLVIRRMNMHIVEVECETQLNPTIAFAIGLLQILGPYLAIDRKAEEEKKLKKEQLKKLKEAEKKKKEEEKMKEKKEKEEEKAKKKEEKEKLKEEKKKAKEEGKDKKEKKGKKNKKGKKGKKEKKDKEE